MRIRVKPPPAPLPASVERFDQNNNAADALGPPPSLPPRRTSLSNLSKNPFDATVSDAETSVATKADKNHDSNLNENLSEKKKKKRKQDRKGAGREECDHPNEHGAPISREQTDADSEEEEEVRPCKSEQSSASKQKKKKSSTTTTCEVGERKSSSCSALNKNDKGGGRGQEGREAEEEKDEEEEEAMEEEEEEEEMAVLDAGHGVKQKEKKTVKKAKEKKKEVAVPVAIVAPAPAALRPGRTFEKKRRSFAPTEKGPSSAAPASSRCVSSRASALKSASRISKSDHSCSQQKCACPSDDEACTSVCRSLFEEIPLQNLGKSLFDHPNPQTHNKQPQPKAVGSVFPGDASPSFRTWSVAGSDVSLIERSAAMDKLEKGELNAGSGEHEWQTRDNRRMPEPMDQKSIATIAGFAALFVLTTIVIGIAVFMFFAM